MPRPPVHARAVYRRLRGIMDEGDRTLALVEKLKKKLADVTEEENGQQEEDTIKILKRLSLIPMSIDILKATQIGKQVNNLRKWQGKVSSKAKSLVKKWKQLLPDATETHHHSTTVSLNASGMELRQTSEHNEDHSAFSRYTEGHTEVSRRGTIPAVHIESEEDNLHRETSHSKKTSHHRDRERKSSKKSGHKRKCVNDLMEDEFSRALAMPLDKSSSSGGSSSSGSMKKTSHHLSRDMSQGRTNQEDVVFVGTSYDSDSATIKKVNRDKSPLPPKKEDASVGMKRKGPVEAKQDVIIAQTKRSRTQVYSGRKVQAGPQAVTSLFDLCMKILIDNIDVIEEVGPSVPYHVLEPLLLRCTATQLMKLEDYNPHLVEDTYELWKKHVSKDFKEVVLPPGQTWRDLYREKMAEREEKLKNLTARIKANSHAREEPVRRVKLAETMFKPGRRSSTRSGGFSRPLERPQAHGSHLMKRTMKMAKERNHMMKFKLGK